MIYDFVQVCTGMYRYDASQVYVVHTYDTHVMSHTYYVTYYDQYEFDYT